MYDAVEIERLLPHRYPFLLVDRIDVLEPGKHVVGVKRLTAGEWWARADAREPIPATLVLEALAQTSGAIVRDLAPADKATIAYFMGADRVRIRSAARAGDELRLEVTVRQWRRGICRTHGIATANGAVVLTADLTTIVRPA